MKTILIGLIKHYKPKSINKYEIIYNVDVYGENKEITINWNIKDPEEHKFTLIEPSRKLPTTVSSYINVDYQTPATVRVCYGLTIDGLTYNVPLTLEETDYVNLLITQLFEKVQNEKLQIIKSVIENEIQKNENPITDGE